MAVNQVINFVHSCETKVMNKNKTRIKGGN